MGAHLPDDGALEDDEHEERKEAVVPVLVEAPQRDAEHLEDKERRGRVLGEERGERRDRDVELVAAVQRLQRGHVCAREAARRVVRRERRARGRRVRQVHEHGRRGGLEDVRVALVAERVRARVGGVALVDGHDAADAAVRSGDEPDAVRVRERRRLRRVVSCCCGRWTAAGHAPCGSRPTPLRRCSTW